MKRAFLICPVRGVGPQASKRYAERIERAGYELHWPPRDTDQDDPTGYRICADNRAAIKAADVVFIVWDGKSQGSLFDAGMAFALDKPVVCLELPAMTAGKSFQCMMNEWEHRG